MTSIASYSHAISVTATTLWESPDAARPVDAPIVAPDPDPRTWAEALSHEEKLDLGSRALSQLLYGEPAHLIEEAGDWVKVVAPWQPSDRDPRGYPGWVPRAHLAAPPVQTAREAVIAVKDATLGTGRRLSFGTILPVLDEPYEGDLVVAIPGGGSAPLERAACVVRDVPSDRTLGPGCPVEPAAVVASARRFVGLEYLWAGLSAYGLDCSGLVHLSFRALGMVVPRDAHDQASAAEHAARADARPGDLYFYARPGKAVHHVGFVAGGRDRILHAPRTGQRIVDEAMPQDRLDTVLDYVGRFTTLPTR